jgi:malonyl-CoA O-methyltransferase
MSSRISATRQQFNRKAHSYDAHAGIQRSMSNRLAGCFTGWKNKGIAAGLNGDGLLQPLSNRILEIGCGTGTLTEILLKEWPDARITALDLAPAMITLAQQRVLAAETNCAGDMAAERLRFLHADVELWAPAAPTASFDLIVSNACFQWLGKPGATLAHLRRLLRPGGSLLFTTFGPDTFREMHQAFNDAYRACGIEPQRHGLSLQAAAQWRSLLRAAGFSDIQYERSLQTEKYASARDFLLAVKAMGASASEAAPMRGLSPRRLFSRMYKEYEDKFSVPGGVFATYELLFIQAMAAGGSQNS